MQKSRCKSYIQKKMTTNIKRITVPYRFFHLFQKYQKKIVIVPGLPDCWINKPNIVINGPLMSLFRTKKTKDYDNNIWLIYSAIWQPWIVLVIVYVLYVDLYSVHTIYQALDMGKKVRMVFLDFTKAFNF
jgi:hypothetical protein